MPPLHCDPLSIICVLQLLSLFTLLTLQLSLSLIEGLQVLKGWIIAQFYLYQHAFFEEGGQS